MNAGGLRPYGAHGLPFAPKHLAAMIVREPRFRPAPPPADDLFARLANWFARLWRALFGNVHIGTHTLPAIGDLLIAVLCALVLIAGVRLAWQAMRASPDQSLRAEPESTRPQSAAEWYARSVEAAERGTYGVAMAALFRATLARLDTRGVLHDDGARTVGECRRSVRRNAPALASAFDAVARPFTAAVYAEEILDRARWEAARAAYDEIVAHAP